MEITVFETVALGACQTHRKSAVAFECSGVYNLGMADHQKGSDRKLNRSKAPATTQPEQSDLRPIRTAEDLARIDPASIIDLTDEVNANWRDILTANPDDPRFKRPPGMPDFHLGRAVGELPPILANKTRTKKK